MDIEANLLSYLDGNSTSLGRMADERYASFDYCFNYFQSFREAKTIPLVASHDNIQLSCMQLGFYLASWGMFRGSTELFEKSARVLVPVIEFIAHSEELRVEDGKTPWDVDVDGYTETNILLLNLTAAKIRDVLHTGATDTLVTKIMLGVFGNVPAFDQYVMKGCKPAGICATFGVKSLKDIGRFYQKNAAIIEKYRVPTLEFETGEQTERKYTRAKVIDMALFIEGMNRDRAAKARGQAAAQG